MTAVYFDSDVTDGERRSRLFAGDIFIFKPTPGTMALIELALAMLSEAFAPHDPRWAHEHLTPEQTAKILSSVKPAFIHHPECKKLLPQILEERGVDLDSIYFDVPRLRSAYPSHFLTSGIAYAFHPHRDTWYSAPTCQLNWWAPVFPFQRNNGMGFFPKYFNEAVPNTSETFNYYDWNSTQRGAAAQNVHSDTREQPKPLIDIEGESQRYVPPPGGMILFSGAQLHESVKNTTEEARYSIDFRTVHIDDVRTRTGAPNVDSKSTGTTMRDYLRGTDLSKLPDDLVALYDDATAAEGKILYFGDRLAVAGNGEGSQG
jgi:hypothetical protein